MKKTYILLSILLIIAFVFTGCGTTDINNDNNDNNEVVNNNIENDVENNIEVENPIEGIEERMTISYLGVNTYKPEFDDSLLGTNYLENLLNIDLEFSKIPANDKPGIDLLVSSSSLPDCGWVYSGVSPAKGISYYDSGAIRSIPVDMVKEYAPQFYELLAENYDYHNLQLVPGMEDEYYVLYAYRYKYDTIGWTICMRYDWMENLNIEPKGDVSLIDQYLYGTNESYTVNEYTDLIYDFTYSDPDMDGENNTYGLILRGNTIDDHPFISVICSPYGLRNVYTPDENGLGYPTEFSPSAKNAYVTIANWINLKVVNPEFQKTDSDKYFALWLSGKVGSACQMISWYQLGNPIPQVLYDQDDTVKVIACPGLVDNDGSGGQTTAYENFLHSQNAGFFFVRSDVDDEKLKRILMFFDKTNSDVETMNYINNGEEGVHYEYDRWGEKLQLDQSELTPEEKIVWGGFDTPSISITDSPLNPDGIRMENKLYKYSIENWEPTSITYLIASDLRQLTDLDWFSRENKKAKLSAESDFLAKVFEGNENIDAEWDNMMNTLNNLGFEEYITRLNEIAYIAEDYKDGNLTRPADVIE